MKYTKNFLLSICAFFLIAWWIGFIWFGYAINQYNASNKEYTDAVIVLTGGRNRVAEGIKILNSDLSGKLFISGVPQKVNIHDIVKVHKIMPDDENKIELGHQAHNTIENAQEIKQWIIANNIKSVRFVTSNYHIPRSLAEFNAYNLPLKIIVHPVYSDKVLHNWWQSWGTFKLIWAEYNKYLFVLARNLIYKIQGGK